MAIKTREELINALMDGAELEHNLACLYLFTAFTIKDSTDEKLDPLILDQLQKWKRDLLKIARQEMGHLGSVCNLLAAVGGCPHLGRPNFPQPAGYYPPDVPFTLEAFGLPALARYVEFERNATAPALEALGVAPEDVTFKHVGELYAAIRDAFQAPGAEAYFIGQNQDLAIWGSTLVEIHAIVAPDEAGGMSKSAQAVTAIEDIMEEGEGTTTGGPDSHYQTFKRIGEELKAFLLANPAVQPARPVVDNPLTRRHRDNAFKGNVIDNPYSADVAQLFNSVYASMVLCLTQYFSFAGENPDQRELLRKTAVALMRQLRPLGDLLTKLVAGPGHPGRNAGPGFEFYRTMQISTTPRIAWPIIAERLSIAAAESTRLSQVAGAPSMAATTLGKSATPLQALADQLRAAVFPS